MLFGAQRTFLLQFQNDYCHIWSAAITLPHRLIWHNKSWHPWISSGEGVATPLELGRAVLALLCCRSWRDGKLRLLLQRYSGMETFPRLHWLSPRNQAVWRMKVELIGESYGISPSGLGSQLVGKDTDWIRSFESRKKSLETPSLASCVRADCALHPEIPTSSQITQGWEGICIAWRM